MTFGAYSAYMPALEAAQRVGRSVVAEILKKWPNEVVGGMR
jgi:hypothetical protein